MVGSTEFTVGGATRSTGGDDMGVVKRCHAVISLSAFRANLHQARETLAGDAKLMVAIKSEAYGHGGVELARAAVEAGADALAVLDIAQGKILRGVDSSIPLLCWLHSPTSDFAGAAEARLDVGISGVWQLELLREQAPGLATRVHLKIDTGLHRNGALPELWPELVRRAAELEKEGHINVVAIWSHLADTSLEEDRSSLQRFHDAVAIAREGGLTPEMLHIAASAAAAELPETRLDLVRIGIIAYGVSPFDDRSAQELGFQPVMAVHARVLSHSSDGTQATLGMGFGDGLLPPLTSDGWVSHGGVRFGIDSVEADHMVISAHAGSALPALGDSVTLWGDPAGTSPRAEDWASWAGTIGDEVVASVAQHVPRRFIEQIPTAE
ncbi:MAG: alanine racemase [Actinomycetota bacterium]|nr:alanine racemase [Actinomycetota bacterium]